MNYAELRPHDYDIKVIHRQLIQREWTRFLGKTAARLEKPF